MRLAKAVGMKAMGSPSAATKPVQAGYGMKHKLRKGTEFQGMSPADAGVGDQMGDYARVVAAGGGK